MRAISTNGTSYLKNPRARAFFLQRVPPLSLTVITKMTPDSRGLSSSVNPPQQQQQQSQVARKRSASTASLNVLAGDPESSSPLVKKPPSTRNGTTPVLASPFAQFLTSLQQQQKSQSQSRQSQRQFPRDDSIRSFSLAGNKQANNTPNAFGSTLRTSSSFSLRNTEKNDGHGHRQGVVKK